MTNKPEHCPIRRMPSADKGVDRNSSPWRNYKGVEARQVTRSVQDGIGNCKKLGKSN